MSADDAGMAAPVADGTDPAANPDAPEPGAEEITAPDVEPAPIAEIAVEFVVACEAADVWRCRALAPLRAGRARTTPVRILWQDAFDGRLAEAGLAMLTIQEAGRSLRQVQRAARDGSLHWLPGMPAPLAAEDEALAPEVALVDTGVFEGKRRSIGLASGAGLAEISLLEGRLGATGWSQPVARLLLRGTPGAVLGLARSLLDELKLGVPATSLSGEVLAHLRPAAAPSTPALHADLAIDDAFARIVGQQAACILHHAPGAAAGLDTESVHQMRVALRRLRSALALFRPVAGCPELEQARRDLGGLARALGPARDWDVFLAGTGRDVARLLPQDAALARLLAAARRRRRVAYAGLAVTIDGSDFQRCMLDLIELALVRPWRRDLMQGDRPRLAAFTRHALDRKLRRVMAVGDDLATLPIDELHALRIRCKRLRYAAEFFVPVVDGKHPRRFLRRLAAVQERLGHLNDGAVAAGLLADLGQRGFAAGIVHGYLAACNAGARGRAERSWRRFRRTPPFWH